MGTAAVALWMALWIVIVIVGGMKHLVIKRQRQSITTTRPDAPRSQRNVLVLVHVFVLLVGDVVGASAIQKMVTAPALVDVLLLLFLLLLLSWSAWQLLVVL